MDQSVNYFYTSCTRSDGWPALTRFHADLEYRLRVQEGQWVSGTLGAQMAPGSVPDGGIAEVSVMIALYSPLYFQNAACGLELAVFQARMRRYSILADQDASRCLIPLCWKPVPEDARPLGLPDPEEWPDTAGWDGGHEDQGLSALMRSDSAEAHDAYFTLIGHLAKRIVEARQTPLTAFAPSELRDMQPAFGSAELQTSLSGPVHTRDSYARPPTEYDSRPALVSVAISYVGADQPWADWMTATLENDGHPSVQQVRRETEDESLSATVRRARLAAERVVVIFSRSYFGAGQTEPLEWEQVFAGADKDWLIPVQIDAEPRPVLVRRGVPVLQLHGSGEQEARRLCEEVREPSVRVPGQREGDAW